MRIKAFVLLFFTIACHMGQDSWHNYVPYRLHDAAMVGFHMDVLKTTNLYENLSLVVLLMKITLLRFPALPCFTTRNFESRRTSVADKMWDS